MTVVVMLVCFEGGSGLEFGFTFLPRLIPSHVSWVRVALRMLAQAKLISRSQFRTEAGNLRQSSGVTGDSRGLISHCLS